MTLATHVAIGNIGSMTFHAAVLTPDHSADDGLNHFGGKPLAGHSPWPTHSNEAGKPLHLIAQISCDELRRSVSGTPLPESGVLQFYLDSTQFVDTDERAPCAVVWQKDPILGRYLAPPTSLTVIGGYAWSDLYPGLPDKEFAPTELPKTPLRMTPIHSTADNVIEDLAKQRGNHWNIKEELIGPWLAWHQALGQPPQESGGGPLSYYPELADYQMLLRLCVDPSVGLLWDGHHNPILSYWIPKTDFAAARWDRAIAVWSDYI
ncbi:MAG: DUF1963 domain-containing protein [Pseudomonadota bacterium]